MQGGRLISFASHTLSSAERNYSIIERECFAIVSAYISLKFIFRLSCHGDYGP